VVFASKSTARSVLRIGHLAPFASLRSPGAKRGSTRTIVYDLLRA
jgi:hypothetical protein